MSQELTHGNVFAGADKIMIQAAISALLEEAIEITKRAPTGEPRVAEIKERLIILNSRIAGFI